MLWDRERMLLDLTETCVGILVTIACALSALLLVVALPPVVLLQRSLLHSQLKAQARTDPKTGVLNAGAWQGEADLAIDRARRRGEPLAVLLADVDHFKNVNDTHGHLTGDAMLRSLAAEMRQQVRESDLVGRFGGEEFAILLVGTTAEEACRVADRIRRGVGVVRVLHPRHDGRRHDIHRRRGPRRARPRPQRTARRCRPGAIPRQEPGPRRGYASTIRPT